jgi:hypothetical protein
LVVSKNYSIISPVKVSMYLYIYIYEPILEKKCMSFFVFNPILSRNDEPISAYRLGVVFKNLSNNQIIYDTENGNKKYHRRRRIYQRRSSRN